MIHNQKGIIKYDLQMSVWLRKQYTFSFVATFHTSCELAALKYFFQVLLIQEA